MKESPCFQNPSNTINLAFANIPRSFQSSTINETGLFDFRRMTVTVMRAKLKRLLSKYKHYRNYKRFDSNVFIEHLPQSLDQASSRNDYLCELVKSVLNLC